MADWYIEASKVQPNPSVLALALDNVLKLAHPFAPFVTEAIWQSLKWDDNLLITSPWPRAPQANKASAKDFEEIKNIISEIRYLTTELDLKKPSLYYSNSSFISTNTELIQRLGRLGSVNETNDSVGGLRLLQTKHQAWLEVDKDSVKQYAARLQERGRQEQDIIKRFSSRLANKNYTQHAPKEVVDQTRQQLEQAREQLAKLQQESKRFSE